MLPFGFARSGSLLLVLASYFSQCRASPNAGLDTDPICCHNLAAAFSPPQVVAPNSLAYNASVSSYWAQQEQLISPACIFLPTSAEDVSKALQILVHGACKFAVRSGGHGSVTGAANIQNGVTLDLSALNTILLSGDKSSVAVGPGRCLGDLYALLYKADLGFAGARASGIGVGGSTLGGGLGVFGPAKGFTCDSVIEFEVVLANGSIVSATKDANSDLWHALKGGGSNFGIVTKIVFSVFPLGNIWTGEAVYASSTVDIAAEAFYDFVADPNYDTQASILMSYGYTADDGPVINNQYVYAAPVVGPGAFEKFYALEGQYKNQTGITSLPALAIKSEVVSPDGQQQITFAMTFQNDANFLQDIWTIYNASIDSISAIDGIAWVLAFEPIVSSPAAQTKANGGNMLGIDVPSQGLVRALFSASFDDAGDYSAVSTAAGKLLGTIVTAAKQKGLYNRYVDLNYAMETQQPFLSYGNSNLAFLKATASTYDPAGIFQKLMPGGFKLT